MQIGVSEEGDILPTVGNFPCVDLNCQLWTFAQSVATQSADGPCVRAGTHLYGRIDGIWCIVCGMSGDTECMGLLWIFNRILPTAERR
jgi:hypothetical protein